MIRSLFSLLLIGGIGFGGWLLGADEMLLEQLGARENRRSAPDWMRNRSIPATTGVEGEYWGDRFDRPQAFEQPRQPQRMRRPLRQNAPERRNRFRRFRLRRQ